MSSSRASTSSRPGQEAARPPVCARCSDVAQCPSTRCQCCAQGKDASRDEPKCCAVGRCCRQLASEWTIHRAWTVLRSVLSAAMREELVTRNVAALVTVPVPRTRKPTVWTVDQARQFLESARAGRRPALCRLRPDARARPAPWGTAGARVGRRRPAARRSPDRVAGATRQRPAAPAQDQDPSSDAPLPLPDICVKALEQRRVTEARWRLAAGEAWSGSGLVLTTRLGDPLDPRNFHRFFKARADKAGVPVISVHATRRTCAEPAGRPRRAPSGRDGHPPPQQDRGDDGHLLAGVLGLHSRGPQAARGGIPVTPTAVLRWGTGTEEALSVERKGPLTCGGAKGTRTPNPLLAKQVRYQLRHGPGG